MADSQISKLSGILDGGAIVAESLNHYQNKLSGTGAALEKALWKTAELTTDAMAQSTSEIKSFTAPFDLEILAIYAVKHGATGTATATLVNLHSSTAKNPLTGTNIDIVGLSTDHIPEAQTVSATQVNLEMEAGDNLRSTFTTAATSTITAATVTIVYRPIQKVSF